MSAMKRTNSDVLKTGSLDTSRNIILLLDRRYAVIASGTHVDGRVKKIRSWADCSAGIAQVVLIDTGHKDPNYMAAVPR